MGGEIEKRLRQAREPWLDDGTKWRRGSGAPWEVLPEPEERSPLKQQFWHGILKPLLTNVGVVAFGLALFGVWNDRADSAYPTGELMKPMLDPARDLAGATPETLAKALLRNRNLRPGPGGKPVRRDQIPVEEPAADEAGDGVPHLGDGA